MADRQVIDAILREGRRRKSPKKLKAALQTGVVESGLRNLPGGDADSQGWRQERKSLYPNPRNVEASVRRFFDEAEKLDKPGLSAAELAARVQRPAAQYRGRYGDPDVQRQIAKYLDGKTSPKTRAEAVKLLEGVPGVKDTTRMQQTFDEAGFEKARRRALVGQLVAKRDPTSLLARVLGTSAPDPAQFTDTKLVGGVRAVAGRARPASASPSSRGSGSGAKGVLRELFWNGPGALNVDDGKRVKKGYVKGHTVHVHAAADNDEDRIWLESHAEKIGLTVTSEGGGRHAPGSLHYKRTRQGRSKGIDVSGDPALMAQYARDVAARFGHGRRRRRR